MTIPEKNDEQSPGTKLPNNYDFEEWNKCNELIDKLDSILIDLRKYGFSVAAGLTTAGSILGLQQFTHFQPFQLIIVFATMALIDVLYWLDVYYQTVISAVILRTQVLEQKLGLGVDIYISRFYMKHRIGKALHLLHIGFLASLFILGAYLVFVNNLVNTSGIPLPYWILFLLLPIFFVFLIWGTFDRKRYETYRKAQAIVSNYLRTRSVDGKRGDKTLDYEITQFLDSDIEDLGVDLKDNEWLEYDIKNSKFVFSKRLIITDLRMIGIKNNLVKQSTIFFDYEKVVCCVSPSSHQSEIVFHIKEQSLDNDFCVKIPRDYYYDKMEHFISIKLEQNYTQECVDYKI